MRESQGVRSLVRGLQVLEVVGELQPVGASELARRLESPKSSVHRLLQTLESAGWITKAPNSEPGWVLTHRVARLGRRVGLDVGLRNAALPVMERLRRETNETVHLALAEPPSMLLVERLESTQAVRYVEALGGLAPMALTATGRASLSAVPLELVHDVLDREPRCSDPEQRKHVLEAVEQARHDGYATTSEWRDGVRATAAAVTWDDSPMPPPALSISAPGTRVTAAIGDLHARLVMQAAEEIRQLL